MTRHETPASGRLPDDELVRLRRRVHELEERLADQRQASAPAICAERRLNQFAKSTNGWFWEMDADLRFTYFSPTVFDITGIRPEWHYGKTRQEIGVSDSVTPEDWEAHLETLGRREPFRGFKFLRRGPDSANWMQTSGNPVFDDDGEFVGYAGVATDITERVDAEVRATRLMFAIENIDEMFVLWDADDRLVLCNARWREINSPVAETTEPGTLFEDHVRRALESGRFPQAHGREQEWLEERLRQHRNPGGAPFELELHDGRWLLLLERRLPDGSSATISTDITERKRAERQLEWRRDELEAAVQARTAHLEAANEEIKRFSYLVSHDLRAPLVNIKGFTRELCHDLEALQALVAPAAQHLDEEQRAELRRILGESIPEATGFIDAAASRMDRQTRALLEYSRLGERKLAPETLDLTSLANDYLKTIAHQIEAQRAEVIVGRMPTVVGDRLSVEQVLGNLLDNAVKFLDPARENRIEVRGERRGHEVVVQVRDTGRGIEARDVKRIFRVFTRAAPPGIEGEGMGLAYVQALTRRLGGRVGCESTPGEGSTFWVALPSGAAAEDLPNARDGERARNETAA